MPVALACFDSTLIVEANTQLYLYRQKTDGTLELIDERMLVTGVGPNSMWQLSFADRYGSHLQQVLEVSDVPGGDDEALHDKAVISFMDPAEPFLLYRATRREDILLARRL